jgi:hypothetical protein
VDYLTELAEAIRNEVDPSSLPDEPVEDLLRSYAVLALTVGESVTPADVHNAWVAWMLPREPDHPALVPFERLDRATAAQDAPFVQAIRAVARRRAIPSGRPA